MNLTVRKLRKRIGLKTGLLDVGAKYVSHQRLVSLHTGAIELDDDLV